MRAIRTIDLDLAWPDFYNWASCFTLLVDPRSLLLNNTGVQSPVRCGRITPELWAKGQAGGTGMSRYLTPH